MSIVQIPFTICHGKSEGDTAQTLGDLYGSTMFLWRPSIPHATILHGMFVKSRKQSGMSSQHLVSWGNFGDFMSLHDLCSSKDLDNGYFHLRQQLRE